MSKFFTCEYCEKECSIDDLDERVEYKHNVMLCEDCSCDSQLDDRYYYVKYSRKYKKLKEENEKLKLECRQLEFLACEVPIMRMMNE